MKKRRLARRLFGEISAINRWRRESENMAAINRETNWRLRNMKTQKT
jgi:hypothetical protein